MEKRIRDLEEAVQLMTKILEQQTKQIRTLLKASDMNVKRIKKLEGEDEWM